MDGSTTDKAFEKGRRFGPEVIVPRCPFGVGTEERAAWLQGVARSARDESEAENIRLADAERAADEIESAREADAERAAQAEDIVVLDEEPRA